MIRPEGDTTIVLCVPLSQMRRAPGALISHCESCGAPIWVDPTSIAIVVQANGRLICNVHMFAELLKPDTFLAIHPLQGDLMRRLLAEMGVPTIVEARRRAHRSRMRRARAYN